MSKLSFPFASVAAAALLSVNSASAADKTPIPSRPQTDGAFRKVLLDSDRQIDGKWVDTLKDPMELAVAPGGRVFYAQRDGTIKVWKPETKTTLVVVKIPVFEGLEEGMLGITLDPNFARNGWIYFNHSLPTTTPDAHGQKPGIIRVSRYTLVGDSLNVTSEKKILDTVVQREECCHVGGSLAFDMEGNLYASVGDNT